MSNWSDTIEYINSFPDVYHFTPNDIKKHMCGSVGSTSIYVNYLHKAGYFKRMKRGVYIRIRLIPTTLTISKVKSFVYPDGKTWEERKQMVERYWKLIDIKEKMK